MSHTHIFWNYAYLHSFSYSSLPGLLTPFVPILLRMALSELKLHSLSSTTSILWHCCHSRRIKLRMTSYNCTPPRFDLWACGMKTALNRILTKSCGVFIVFGPTFETLEGFLTAGVSERNWLWKERKLSWWKLLLANKSPFRECLFSCPSPSRFVCFYFTAELVLYVLAVCSRKCVSLQPDRLSHTWVAIQMSTLWSVYSSTFPTEIYMGFWLM